MGILDDAIREHLDLQRRRGADPAEVERAEREALGPVRRNREATEAPEVEADLEAAGGFAYDQEDESAWAYDSSEDERLPAAAGADEPLPLEFTEPVPPLTSPGSDGPPEPDPRRRRIRYDDDLGGALGASEPFAADPAPAAGGPGSGETVEYDVDQALGGDDDKDDDVLEETPEFLQDTPDHDRLWFEQRPPRDFDFDS